MGLAEGLLGGFPVETGVGDADTIFETFQRGGEGLVAGLQVALDHDGVNGAVSGLDLFENILKNGGLAVGILAAVAMAAVDHNGDGELAGFKHCGGFGNFLGVEIWAIGATAQDELGVGIATGGDGGGLACRGDAQESLSLACGDDGINGSLEFTAGGVFEPDGHGEAGGHLPVGLALDGPGADGGPAKAVGNELRGDGVEEFGGRWESKIQNLTQEAAGLPESLGDVVCAVEFGVHDQPLPAGGGTRFFEVHAHDEKEPVVQFFGEGRKLLGVFPTGVMVMNGAGADDGEQAGVLPVNDFVNGFPALLDDTGLDIGARTFGQQLARRGERLEGFNAQIDDRFHFVADKNSKSEGASQPFPPG